MIKKNRIEPNRAEQNTYDVRYVPRKATYRVRIGSWSVVDVHARGSVQTVHINYTINIKVFC